MLARAGTKGLLSRIVYLRAVTHAAGLCLVSGLSQIEGETCGSSSAAWG